MRLFVFVLFLAALTAWAVLNLNTSDRELKVAFQQQSSRLAKNAKTITKVKPVPPEGEEPAEEESEDPRRAQLVEPPPDYGIRALAVTLLEQAERAIARAKTLQRRRPAGGDPSLAQHPRTPREVEALTRQAEQLGKRAVVGLMEQAESLQAHAEESKRRADQAAADAQPLLERALAVQQSTLGPDHPQIVATLNRVAQLHARQGRYEEAEALLQRALAIQENSPEPDRESVAGTLQSYVGLLQKTGRDSEAEGIAARMAQILGDQSHGEPPVNLAR